MLSHMGHTVTDVVLLGYTTTGVVMRTNSLTGHNTPAVSGVYLITDTISGKTYVGSSKNIRTRAITHFSKMNTGHTHAPYSFFTKTFLQHGPTAFAIGVVEECSKAQLLARELYWLDVLQPTENTMLFCANGIAFSEDERMQRSERTKKLWADPSYREKAVNSRKGKAYSKGYKCTPEQTENRRKAGRISNMKRNYGAGWKEEYTRRYPEFAGDLNGK